MLLSLLAALAALAAIAADWRSRHPLFYLAKPLATVLILSQGLSPALPPGEPYARWILAGGGFCLLGDLLLLGRGSRWFAAGLAAFLVGHLLLIFAFRDGGPYDPPSWSLALAASGIVAAAAVARRAGRLHTAVAVYAAALLAMLVCAAARDAAFAGAAGSRCALLGAGLFVLSDGVLAVRRFVRDFSGGQTITLASYYAALWLIVHSIPGLPNAS
jgi:uncharacterized membrane protein YhhN